MKMVLLGLAVVSALLLSGCASLNTFSMPQMLPKQSPMAVHAARICNTQYGYYSCHPGYLDRQGNEVYLQTTRTCVTYLKNGWFTWGGSSGNSCQYGVLVGPAIQVEGNPYGSYHYRRSYEYEHEQQRYWYGLPSVHW